MRFDQLDSGQRAELWAALALHGTRGLGACGRKKLADRFGSPYQAVLALNEWGEAGLDIKSAAISYFRSDNWREEAKAAWARIKSCQAEILLYSDPLYPLCLKEISDAPLFLFCLGDLTLLKNTALAVVGTRKCTREGLEVTANIVRGLTRAGITTISGLARGIDRAAHLAGLEGIGSSIAVLGSGIDVPYPDDNLDLYELMRERGLLLSEQMPGTAPLARHFPVRNRIISGLAKAVLVVEASLRSGTLITARHAIEQNRDVFAVPGGSLADTSEGCRELIRRGARPVFAAEDILCDLAPVLQVELDKKLAPLSRALPSFIEKAGGRAKLDREPFAADTSELLAATEKLGQEEKQILNLLAQRESFQLEEISAQLDCPVAKLSGVLVVLEMKGLVRRLPGMCYKVIDNALLRSKI